MKPFSSAFGSPDPQRDKQRSDIEAHTAAFLAAGGKIEPVTTGKQATPATESLHAHVERRAAATLGVRRKSPGIRFRKDDRV